MPYIPKSPVEFTVEPGKETEVTIEVVPAARVEGRVIDAKTGVGIPSTSVILNQKSRPDLLGRLASTNTDNAGRFRAFVYPGEVGVEIYGPPAGYLRLGKAAAEPAKVRVGVTHTFPDVRLEPAVPPEGVVVDAAGKPVPLVVVRAAHEEQQFSALQMVTDKEGRFTVCGLGPMDVTALRARTAEAATDGGVPLDMARQQGPLKLVLSQAHALRLKGTVLDNRGQPVPDAAVRIEWRYQGAGLFSRLDTSVRLETYRTDSQGRFRTQALWPGDDYKVAVNAIGYGKAETTWVKSGSGTTFDFGPITVRRAAERISGVVVDAAGKPITGVNVFNRGDAPKPLHATTGADGRFRLDGLYDGTVFVFARKEGFRFTSIRTTTDARDLTVTLLKAGEVPADQPNPRPPDHVAAERKLTRNLLESLWAFRTSIAAGHEDQVLEAMTRVDLSRARRWLAEEKRRNPAVADANSFMSWSVRVAEAEIAVREDVDKALGILAPLKREYTFDPLLRWAEHYRTIDPAKALRLAEEAGKRTRSFGLPDRAWRWRRPVICWPGWVNPRPGKSCWRKLPISRRSLGLSNGRSMAEGRLPPYLALSICRDPCDCSNRFPKRPKSTAGRRHWPFIWHRTI